MIVVDPWPELRVIADGKGRRLPHPDIALALIPADEGFIAGQLIETAEMLDLDAPPLKLGAGKQELFPPRLGRCFNGIEDCLLVHEKDGQLRGIDLSSLDQLIGQVGKNDAVLAAGKREVYGDTVGKYILDPLACRSHNVDV